MFTVSSLVDTGAGPDLLYKDSLPPAWRRSMKMIESPPFPIENCQIVTVEGIVPLIACMDDLTMCAWFKVVDNLAVEVLLGTLFIDC